MNCTNKNCRRYIRREFNYFCYGCYHEIKKNLRINNSEFLKYINSSFNKNYIFRDDCRFTEIYDFLLLKNPNIKPLANILESILYIKYLLSDIDLKNKIHFKIYNDNSHNILRINSTAECWINNKFNKSIYNPEIRLLL